MDAGQPELRVERGEDADHLGVEFGRLRAERLDAKLVVLPVAARLRALVAEHGAMIVELHRLGQRVHAVLHIGSRHGGRALWTERHASAAEIVEGVHLFAHDVRRVAHSPREETRVFEGRSVDAAIAVPGKDGLSRSDHPATDRLLLGKDVVRPLRREEGVSHGP